MLGLSDEQLQEAKAAGVEVVILVYDPRGTVKRMLKSAFKEQRRVRIVATEDRASFYDAEKSLKTQLKRKTK